MGDAIDRLETQKDEATERIELLTNAIKATKKYAPMEEAPTPPKKEEKKTNEKAVFPDKIADKDSEKIVDAVEDERKRKA